MSLSAWLSTSEYWLYSEQMVTLQYFAVQTCALVNAALL